MTFVKADKGKTNNKNDKCMTPPKIAEQLCMLLPVKALDTCLEPFMGDGAFYRFLPSLDTDWCEIDKGRDFLTISEKLTGLYLIHHTVYLILC